MKNLFLLVFCLFAVAAQATIHTVSNDVNNPAQFANMQDAHDAAAPGDTLYVTPSPTQYGHFTMTRQLTVIGNGYVPEVSGQITYKTEIQSLSVGYSTFNSASGSTFLGLKIGNILVYSGATNPPIDNINIIECNVGWIGPATGQSRLTNLNAKHSVLSISYFASGPFVVPVSSGVIQNCILTSFGRIGLSGSNYPTFLVKNCIISGSIKAQNCIMENNIFVEANVDADKILNSNFSNNILFNSTGDALPLTINNNTGGGNLDGTNPDFVSYDLGGGLAGSMIDNEDYHLNPTSPGKFYGTDGTDVGIYGGTDPFPAGPYNGIPAIPKVTLFNLLNSIVGPNGQLNYEVEATTQN